MRFKYSLHAEQVIKERVIDLCAINMCIVKPDCIERHDDGTVHYCKCFANLEGRWLRVIINPLTDPELVVTAFFDRRLRRQHDHTDR